MRTLAIVRAIAVVSTGLFAGILLGDRAGATFARPQLSPSSFVQFQQIVHANFVRMMPPLILTALLAGLLWLLWIRARSTSAEFWLVLSATGVVNVPINEQLMTWSVESPPVNVRELWAPWERAHTVRNDRLVGRFRSRGRRHGRPG